MLRVEAAGYPIVLHVHDEHVCEVPIGFGSTGRIYPPDDTQTGLGTGAADCSQCGRASLLQIERRNAAVHFG